MSDQSQGSGWWLASDGKWYPPDQAPAVPPADTWASPPPGPPTPTGLSAGAKALIAGLVVVGLLVVAGLVVLLVGNDDDPSSESSETTTGEDDTAVDLPAGYHVVEGDGVSIGVPEGWEGMSPEDAGLSEEEFEQAFPEASEEMLERGVAAVDQGSVLVAFDVASASSDNVNIIEIPTRVELSVMEQQAETELDALGADIESIEAASIPAGDALRADYTLDVTLPDGGTVPTQGVQYYVVTDERAYVVTFSSASEIGELATTMIDTFRVG